MSSMKEEIDFSGAVELFKNGSSDISTIVERLLSRLSDQERLWLLDGDEAFWPGLHKLTTEGFNHVPYICGEVKRLGIPGIRFSDGPRGCVMGKSTAFPVPMARGASWDDDLEERIGRVIGRECRALGANFYGGVCVNLPRHPAWGRIQETYGEDPILLGKMGAALARGAQEHVMACVKHFALNSMENGRFKVDVEVDEDVLHEVYLPHFRHIVENGVSSVMSAYNSVRGEFAGQSKALLTDVLREQWKFQGFVINDFLFGFRDAPLSVKAGLDLEAPFRQQRAMHLENALHDGTLGIENVNRSCKSILRRQIEHEATRTIVPPRHVVFCDEHRKLAREAATKSMVLLKNSISNESNILPLNSKHLSKVAIIGHLADSVSTGDKGSSQVRSPIVISPYKGIKAALPSAKVTLEDSDDVRKIREAAMSSDVAIVIVGYTFRDEGEYTAPAFNATPGLKHVIPPSDGSEKAKSVIERLMTPKPTSQEIGKDNYGFGTGGDRTSLRLRPRDVEVIKAVAQANERTIVCIVAGGAVIIEEWKHLVPAIVFNFYSGCEGGHALADLLFGRENFGGRLPFVIPTQEEHLPDFDMDAERIRYDRWFGQAQLDRLRVAPAFPLGYGLSYTKFSLSNIEVLKSPQDNEELKVKVLLSNIGHRKGRYIAQVYGAVNVNDWPRRCLLGFKAVDLEPGEQIEVEIRASTRPLRRWNRGAWDLVSDDVQIEVGGFSGDSSVRKIYNFGHKSSL